MNFKHTYFVLAISLCLVSANTIKAQTKSKTAQVKESLLPFDKAVRTGKLANGFTYYIRHNEEPKNRVVMYLANKVGSIQETDDQRGLAHFMEHMNFNGTKNFPNNELVDYLQKIGVRFGADINAYTSFDETVYQLPLPSDKPEIVQNGLKIMRDWAHGALLDPLEIDKERGVILEEKRLGKGSQERMATRYYPMLFNNSRYTNRLPIGTDEVLKNFDPGIIRRYYDDWYRPNLQALIIVGDVDVDKMEKEIKALFTDLKNPANTKKHIKYNIPLTGKNQFMAVTDKEMPYTQVQIFIKQTGSPLQTRSQYKEALLQDLFSRAVRERIAELSQSEQPKFIDASMAVGDFLADLKIFTASVTANPGELENGFKTIWREVQRIKKYGITKTELDRAKASLINNIDTELAEKTKRASDKYVREYLQHFLKGTSATGIDYEHALTKKLLAEITVMDINRLVNNSIKENNRDILIMAPEKDKGKLPTEMTFLSWMKAVEGENITSYKDNTNGLPLLKKQPIPGKIVKTVRDAKLDITTLTLSNGVKVILKKTNFKNDEIFVNAVAFGGNSLYPDSVYRTAFAAHTISRFGAGNYNSSQLRKYLSGKQAQVTPIIDERTQQIYSNTTNKDLALSLEMVYAYITEPRLDLEQFKGSIANQIASMANSDDNPGSVFLDTVIAAQHPQKTPRRTRPKVADLQTINPNMAFEIYKERWADASGLTFTFVGNIDTLAIRPLLEKYIASLPSTYKNETYRELHINPVHGRKEKIVYMGQAPKATVQLYFTGDFDYNLKDNLVLEAMNETLSIKITERLRETEGGVYSPQVQAGGTSLNGGWYNIIIQFGCAPGNVDKLIAAANDEISKMLKNGPTETDLKKFKAEKQRQLETAQQTNSYWSSYFRKQLIEGGALDEILDHGKLIEAITIDDVKKIAIKYFNYENYSKFVLMPDKHIK